MQIIGVQNSKTFNQALQKSADILTRDGIIICPADTCYILAANAESEVAIKKVFKIKKRTSDMPLGIMIADIKQAEKYVYLNQTAEKLYQEFFPGRLTVISEKRKTVSNVLTAGKNTLGISIPDNQFCLDLAKKTELAFTGTSANVSGGKTPYSIEQSLEQFDHNFLRLIDLAIDFGHLPEVPTTTIIDTTLTPPQIIREGAIPSEKIFTEIAE